MSYGSASRYMSTMHDLNRREFFVVLPLIIVSFILGVYPNVVLDALHLPLSSLLIGVNTPQDPEILLSFLSGFLLYKETKTKIPLMGVVDNPKHKLDPYFVTGFTDAEGSFMINITKRNK